MVKVWVWLDEVWHKGYGCIAPGVRWAPDSKEIRVLHPEGHLEEMPESSQFGSRAYGD